LVKLKGKWGKRKKQTESRNKSEMAKERVDKKWENLPETSTVERG
jgi:hypothetical protein